MKTYSLYELNNYIRRVLTLNFQDSLWITAEIANANYSRGHLFLELVQKDGEESDLKAKADAVVWKNTIRKWGRQKAKNLESVSLEGVEVQLEVMVQYHEIYGIKLEILDIELSFTLGQLALQRQKNIQQLQAEGLIELNKSLPLPTSIQRIAVISSPTAAGFQDFREHLQNNPYDYQFHIELFPASMQGNLVEKEMLQQLERIKSEKAAFDCVAIMRGGGAKLDLVAFDQLGLCRAIAQFPLPVVSGIGHDIDESLLDKVVFESLKTPTAVADFFITHQLNLESGIVWTGQQICYLARQILQEQLLRLEQTNFELQRWSSKWMEQQQYQLDTAEEQLERLILQFFKDEQVQLTQYEEEIASLDPANVLKRGFTYTTFNDLPVSKSNLPQEGDQIQTYFEVGKLKSIVKKSDS